MKNYYISVNQFAEFSKATPKGKKRILNQQILPNKLLIPWYQLARGAMKKYLKDVDNQTPIEEAIEKLTDKIPTGKRQEIDRRVSLEALLELKTFAFPKMLRNVEFEIVKPTQKSFLINNVNIIVAPDVVLKGKYKGETIYGAIKVHICKRKPFDDKQSKHVANLIYKYLSKTIEAKDGIILPDLCICLDIFGGRITPSSGISPKENSEIKDICGEVKDLWTV